MISFPAGDKLWWADQGTDQIGTCDKKDGGNWKVMRNNTSPMMHMRIYDEDVQKGEKNVVPFEASKRNRFHLESLLIPFSWNQPLQQQQRRLLPALPSHVPHN